MTVTPEATPPLSFRPEYHLHHHLEKLRHRQPRQPQTRADLEETKNREAMKAGGVQSPDLENDPQGQHGLADRRHEG